MTGENVAVCCFKVIYSTGLDKKKLKKTVINVIQYNIVPAKIRPGLKPRTTHK